MSDPVANLVISLVMLAVMVGGITWAVRTGRLKWPFH